MQIIRINKYLKFVVRDTPLGTKVTCFHRNFSVATKHPCSHAKCLIEFIAEYSIAVEQMERFSKALEPSENLN